MGTPGGSIITVNTLGGVKSLGPDEFRARTLQWRIAAYGNGATVFEESVIVESFTMIVPNVGSVPICNVYDVAPITAVQTNVGVLDTRVAESAGNNWTGAGGACVVVKRNIEENGPMPPTFFPLTLQ